MARQELNDIEQSMNNQESLKLKQCVFNVCEEITRRTRQYRHSLRHIAPVGRAISNSFTGADCASGQDSEKELQMPIG